MAWQIRSTSSIALGNGTRPRGFLFGSLADEESYVLAVDAASNADIESVKSLVQLAEGVEVEEVVNALRTQLFGGPIQVDDADRPSPQPENDKAQMESIATEQLGLSPAIETALLNAGLATVKAIVDFAELNDGLQSLDGIGKAAEEKIKAAIQDALSN